MSGSLLLPDNALLRWLQDESNNDFLDPEALDRMYQQFAAGQPDPLDELKDDDRHHSYLLFSDNEEGVVVAQIVHHLARFPKRMGVTTPYDGNWYLTSNQPVQGQHITYALPFDLFFDRIPW